MPDINRRRFLQLAGAHRRVRRDAEQHRAGRRDPGASPVRRHQDVEHIVVLMQENRSFDHYFGTLQRRPRLRRPAPGDAAERQVGLAPVGRHQGRSCPSTRTPTTSACSSSRTSRTAGPTATRRTTTASTTSGCPAKTADDDGVPDPRGHPVPLRARRHVHHLRRLPLLVHRLHRPEPLLHVDRLHRQRRHRRRPGPRQRRGRLRLDDVPGAAGAGRRLLEDLPGHRRRPGRGRHLGLDRRRLPRQLRRQLAAVLQHSTATPSPATRCTTRPAPAPNAKAGDGFFDQPDAPT